MLRRAQIVNWLRSSASSWRIHGSQAKSNSNSTSTSTSIIRSGMNNSVEGGSSTTIISISNNSSSSGSGSGSRSGGVHSLPKVKEGGFGFALYSSLSFVSNNTPLLFRGNRSHGNTSSALGSLSFPLSSLSSSHYSPLFALRTPARGIFSDKIRAGMVLTIDKKYFRVMGNTRSQKGQNAASFNIKLTEVGTGRKKEVTAGQGHDFQEVRAERVRLLFSGFDDDDFACFVFPEHHSDAGKEVNLAGDSLPELQQKFLSCGMPVDILHIIPDEDDMPSGGGDSSSGGSGSGGNGNKEVWSEVMMPSSYVFTVEKITLKGLYKMATFVECDGSVSVNDSVQLNDKVKILLKPDGTAAFGGRATA